MPSRLTYNDIRTVQFFPPAESTLVNSNFGRINRMKDGAQLGFATGGRKGSLRIVTRGHSSIPVTKLNWHSPSLCYLMYRQILRSEANNMKNNPLRRIYITSLGSADNSTSSLGMFFTPHLLLHSTGNFGQASL